MKTIELTDEEADVIRILCEHRIQTFESGIFPEHTEMTRQSLFCKSILEKL